MKTSISLGAARCLPVGPRRRAIACGSIVAAFAVGVLLSGCSSSDGPAGGSCADNSNDIAMEDNAFLPTVEYYTVKNDGMTVVLYAEVDVVNDSYFVNWSEENDRILVNLTLFGPEPRGPEFVYSKVSVELDAPLDGRTVCYGTTELVENASLG